MITDNGDVTTFDQVKEALLQVAKAHPDRVQPRYDSDGRVADRLNSAAACRYTDPDGLPSCIIGRVADILGLPRPAWGDAANRGSIDELFSAISVDAAILAGRVQARADLGDTWGEAVAQVVQSARRFTQP